MSYVLEDGTGSGNRAKVDERNKLKVAGITESEAIFATSQGDGYNVNTGYMTITGDATLAYIKNNDDKIMVIDAIAIGSKDGNAVYSDDPHITIYRNPTGGNLITEALPVAQNQNRNFGSNNVLNGLAYKGKVGGNISGGNEIATLQLNAGSRNFFTIDFFLPKGSSMAVDLTSNITSGSSDYYLAFIVYFLDPAIF